MKVKTLFVLFVFASLLISFMFSFGAAASSGNFSDVDYSHENFEAVDYLKNAGVIEGYSDGNYKPENTINRAEFLKIVMESSDYDLAGSNCYPDVKNAWYSKYVCKATELGFVKGYDDGYFRPEKTINFAEASKIVANVLEVNVEGDSQSDKPWYEKYVSALDKYNGVPKSISSFGENLSRGEMAEVVWRIKQQPTDITYTSYRGIERKEEARESDGDLLKFQSCADLGEHIKENSGTRYYGYMEESVMLLSADGDVAKSAEAPGSEAGLGSTEDTEYSSTNVQVEGVDEADIVKNDGEYVYVLKGATVRVVKAYPAGEMEELDRVTFTDTNFYPSDMYVDGDRLVVIGTSFGSVWDVSPTEQNLIPETTSTVLVYIFDITDKAAVSEIRELSFEGYYSSSRKVDDMVYLVANKSEYIYEIPEEYDENEIVPLYGDSAKEEVEPVSGCTDIWYWPVESTQYLIVAGIPIDDPVAEITKEVVLGSYGNIYASRENLYVAESSYGWDWWWGEGNSHEEETNIHKFRLGSDIEYLGNSAVPGTILNQFSMDEYQGNFRIATTLGNVWDTENLSQNNIYILDENLNRMSSIEGIAPGEKIYSVRFMGDRMYMVTFKKIDPFFVIDVSDPYSPQILGKLKIPGYSDYLHPYDENHIIGFGKEAVDASEEEIGTRDLDFAWYQGMKVAMFDVSDVSNPVELHKVVIGDRGTDSELLRNHKALLFDKEKGLMAFPVTLAEIPDEVKNDPETSADTYGDYIYQGAYVYDVSVENGFEFKGKITHYNEDEIAEKAGYYWWGDEDVSRILYIGDFLYTVSQAKVRANNLEDLEYVNEVVFGE